MSHIPQCDCSQCIAYRQHAVRKERDEIVANAFMESVKEAMTLPKREIVPPHPTDRYAGFNELLKEIKALHDSKGADYEGSGVPYANLRASEEWGVPAWVYAMLRGEEKMRRLKTYAKGSTLQHEGARDSQIDIAVLALISIVLREDAGL